MTAATEAKTRMVSSLKTEAKGTTAVMKMITAVLSTALSLLMPKGTTRAMTKVLTRAITVGLAATVLDQVMAAKEAIAVMLVASASLLVRIVPLMVFVLHPLSCQH